MFRYRVAISGGALVGPGVATFYSLSTISGFPAAVQAFFFSQAAKFPTGTTFTFTNGGDQLSDATGALTGVWSSGTAPNAVVGSGTGAFALGVGCQVRWRTTGIVGGRRVVGSTFLVPCVSSTFDSDGTLVAGAVSSLQSGANALIAAIPDLVVWSRPHTPTTKDPRPARAGSSHTIIGATVPDRPSWLRSRRV